MSKKSTGKEIIIGAAVLGLLTGGTAMASTHMQSAQVQQDGQFFKAKELKSGFELAKKDKKDGKAEKSCKGKDCKSKDCKGKEKKCKSKSCKEKDCKGKDGKVKTEKTCKADKKCGEGSCGKDKK